LIYSLEDNNIYIVVHPNLLMVYSEIKTIKGRKYKYLRESVRIRDKVIHRTVKYLGPVKPIYKTKRKIKRR